ncbi:hypothetical protein AMR41_24390 [Hapalosiphon sp. MRB220]|nr:hypothetical protein AMR41_24390 [Hapalosiphon sp. MRB220]
MKSQQLALINFQEKLMIISDLNHIESVESSHLIGGYSKNDKDRDKDKYKCYRCYDCYKDKS